VGEGTISLSITKFCSKVCQKGLAAALIKKERKAFLELAEGGTQQKETKMPIPTAQLRFRDRGAGSKEYP